jgi:hypothetical protein
MSDDDGALLDVMVCTRLRREKVEFEIVIDVDTLCTNQSALAHSAYYERTLAAMLLPRPPRVNEARVRIGELLFLL